ncbi:MAG: glucose PTS transporter subunit EIIB, partial [Tetragenococcus koreensis]|nr:glucose PTS transporter subunit EIIB [Tetragenococcus koreensis]
IVFFFIYYFTFYYLITKLDIETLGREKESNYTEESSEEEKDLSLNTGNYEYLAKKLLESLGGKDNIDDMYNCVTRMRVTVSQPNLVDEERIKQTGISGIVKPSENHFQIVIGPEVTSVMGGMNKLLDE